MWLISFSPPPVPLVPRSTGSPTLFGLSLISACQVWRRLDCALAKRGHRILKPVLKRWFQNILSGEVSREGREEAKSVELLKIKFTFFLKSHIAPEECCNHLRSNRSCGLEWNLLEIFLLDPHNFPQRDRYCPCTKASASTPKPGSATGQCLREIHRAVAAPRAGRSDSQAGPARKHP